MKLNRKNFLKVAGFATAGMMVKPSQAGTNSPFSKNHVQKFNMHGYSAPKLDKVRVGFIGVGSRGSGTVVRLSSIEGVEVKALCDLIPDRIDSVIKLLKNEFPAQKPMSYSGSPDLWKEVCEREDIDLIYIATPWQLHAPIAIYAMEHGKHVYTELPVGVTLEECWQVVETSENTRRHCFMGCGSAHDGMAAVILNMVRQGFFGEIIHGEGHYIHDRVSDNKLRWERDKSNNNWFGYRPWRLQENVNRNGNLYPAHGLGPVSQMMDINYGDKMEYLVSISSNDFTMGHKMKEMAEIDDYYKPYVGLNLRGNINTTIIRTHKGRTIMLQHDISSPRPGHRFDLISGNKGIYRARPDRIATSEEWLPEEEFNSLKEKYTPEITKKFNEKRNQAGGSHGSRGYERVTASDWRLIDCLRNGLPLEMDVYDAALWSAITPLSEWSVARQGETVKIPDFTCGAWRTNKRGMDINIQQGGTTNLI
ncbi:Gfo/Idh/MocA family protein [Mariniphaga sediminis]|uniref:Gfo/Idh/MocA family protein n=1 Tax=Mariniphaga sediminis TaxID=1628158 RepID=UPI00356249A5